MAQDGVRAAENDRGENAMLKVCKFEVPLAGAAEFLRVRDPWRRTSRGASSWCPRRGGGTRTIRRSQTCYICATRTCATAFPAGSFGGAYVTGFFAIRDGCGLHMPLERELESIYASLNSRTEEDFLASRGEYLAARLMAELLGFAFVDAAEWLRFDYDGQVREEESYALLASLADGRKIVTPGFYGTLPDGRIHTFPRGGSDVTGALAAAALRADVYENWTDVPGVTADPASSRRRSRSRR